MGRLHVYDTGIKVQGSTAGEENLRNKFFDILSQYVEGIVKVDDGNNHYIRDGLFDNPALGMIPKNYDYNSRYYLTVHGNNTSSEYGCVRIGSQSSDNILIYHTPINGGCIFSPVGAGQSYFEDFIYALFRRKIDNHLILIYSGAAVNTYNMTNGFVLADLSTNENPIVEYSSPKLPHDEAKIDTECISLAPFVYNGFDYGDSNSIFLAITYPVLARSQIQSFTLKGKEYVNLRTLGCLPFTIELVS